MAETIPVLPRGKSHSRLTDQAAHDRGARDGVDEMASAPKPLEAVFQSALRFFPGGIESDQQQLLRADLEMTITYAGSHVAYRDIWQGPASARTLRREYIAVASSREAVLRAAADHEQCDEIECEYLPAADDELEPVIDD